MRWVHDGDDDVVVVVVVIVLLLLLFCQGDTPMMAWIRLEVSWCRSDFSIPPSYSRRNWFRDVWYMGLTSDISTIKK